MSIELAKLPPEPDALKDFPNLPWINQAKIYETYDLINAEILELEHRLMRDQDELNQAIFDIETLRLLNLESIKKLQRPWILNRFIRTTS